MKTPEPKTKRVADPELQALSRIGDILNSLTTDTRRRVLAWIKDRYEPLRNAEDPHGMD